MRNCILAAAALILSASATLACEQDEFVVKPMDKASLGLFVEIAHTCIYRGEGKPKPKYFLQFLDGTLEERETLSAAIQVAYLLQRP